MVYENALMPAYYIQSSLISSEVSIRPMEIILMSSTTNASHGSKNLLVRGHLTLNSSIQETHLTSAIILIIFVWSLKTLLVSVDVTRKIYE
jgi:hypothetical protein